MTPPHPFAVEPRNRRCAAALSSAPEIRRYAGTGSFALRKTVFRGIAGVP